MSRHPFVMRASDETLERVIREGREGLYDPVVTQDAIEELEERRARDPFHPSSGGELGSAQIAGGLHISIGLFCVFLIALGFPADPLVRGFAIAGLAWIAWLASEIVARRNTPRPGPPITQSGLGLLAVLSSALAGLAVAGLIREHGWVLVPKGGSRSALVVAQHVRTTTMLKGVVLAFLLPSILAITSALGVVTGTLRLVQYFGRGKRQ